jgi:hypothetical protein
MRSLRARAPPQEFEGRFTDEALSAFLDPGIEWIPVAESPHDTEGAPTAGPPPYEVYEVYEVTPAIAFGFGTDETLTPTRWRF